MMSSKLRKTLFCRLPSALLTVEDYCRAEVSVAGHRCVLQRSNQMISHETGSFKLVLKCLLFGLLAVQHGDGDRS